MFISGITEKNPHRTVMIFGPLSLHHPSRCNLDEGQTERRTTQKDKFTDRRLNVTFAAEQRLTTHGRALDGLQQTLRTQCLQMHRVISSLSVDGILPHKGGADESKQTGLHCNTLCLMITAVAVFLRSTDIVFHSVPLPPSPLSGYTFSNQAQVVWNLSPPPQLKVFTFGDGKYFTGPFFLFDSRGTCLVAASPVTQGWGGCSAIFFGFNYPFYPNHPFTPSHRLGALAPYQIPFRCCADFLRVWLCERKPVWELPGDLFFFFLFTWLTQTLTGNLKCFSNYTRLLWQNSILTWWRE